MQGRVVSRMRGPRSGPLSHATSTPRILLLHDGELADVAALLRELGAAITERRGGAAAEDAEPSWRLLVASARRALEIPTPVLRASALHLAILDGESRTVLSLLRRARFELVVRRPVHPAALRLLLLHGLYRGPEKRRSPRVSVGAPVHVRAALRRHPAILAELSERGCRLLSAQRVSLGQTLTLQIPAALAGGHAFSLKGLVVRATPPQIGAAGVVTLEFDPLRGALRERVRALVSAHSGGPSALARGDTGLEGSGVVARPPSPAAAVRAAVQAAAATPAAEPPVPPAGAPNDARPLAEPAPQATPRDEVPISLAREHDPAAASASELAPATEPDADLASEFEVQLDGELEDDLERRALPRRLVPLCNEASRVVLARALSRDGMRADPSLRLVDGAELRLALHLEAGGRPLEVRAHVEAGSANDPSAGPWLRFKDLSAGDGERLDAVLASLSIFAGGDEPEHALVVCEILDTPAG